MTTRRPHCEVQPTKVKFLTEADAASSRHRSRLGHAITKPYECPSCGYWHLTKKGATSDDLQTRDHRGYSDHSAA